MKTKEFIEQCNKLASVSLPDRNRKEPYSRHANWHLTVFANRWRKALIWDEI